MGAKKTTTTVAAAAVTVPVTARPLSSRPLDAVWLAWFVVHLGVMFCVDLVCIYPAWLTPAPLLAMRRWYIGAYGDRFFVAPPAWFLSFIWMEALYHVPVSLWAVRALLNDNPLVPLHLLVWSVQTFITTLVCVVDIISWPGITSPQMRGLCGLYVPYCVLAAVIGIDMFFRIKARLDPQKSVKSD